MLSRLYIPFHLLILVPLLALALPLALLAVLTTTLALVTLFARLTVVYLDLALALLTSWIPPFIPSPTAARKRSRASTATSPRLPPPAAAPSATATLSPTATATPSPRLSRRTSRSDSHVSVVLGLGVPNRDYEGVGGWRLVDDEHAGLGDPDAGGKNNDGNHSDDDDDDDGRASDEATWVGWNSRLERPASGGVLRKQRSLTGSSSATTAAPMPLDRARRGVAAAMATSAGREDDGGILVRRMG